MVASISFGSNAIKSYDKQSDIVYPNVISQSEVKEGHDNQSGKVAKTLMSQAGTFVVAAGVQALAGKAGIAKEVVNPHNAVQKLQNPKNLLNDKNFYYLDVRQTLLYNSYKQFLCFLKAVIN